jgi:hypothetical protein
MTKLGIASASIIDNGFLPQMLKGVMQFLLSLSELDEGIKQVGILRLVNSQYKLEVGSDEIQSSST